MYTPNLGVWMQRDPAEEGLNLYENVRSNPVNLTDPLGLAAWKVDPSKKWDDQMIKTVKKCIREKVEKWIKEKKEGYDCADVALTALAECAREQGLPLTIPVWDAKAKAWTNLRSQDDKYKDADAYLNDLRSNLGAMNLIDRDRVTTPKDLDKLEGGDMIIYDLRYQNNPLYTGHTRNVLDNDPQKKQVTVGEGHLTGPVQVQTYTYDQIKSDWQGPVGMKGREWNWKVLGR